MKAQVTTTDSGGNVSTESFAVEHDGEVYRFDVDDSGAFDGPDKVVTALVDSDSGVVAYDADGDGEQDDPDADTDAETEDTEDSGDVADVFETDQAHEQDQENMGDL